MRSIEWLCCRSPWVTFKHLKPLQFVHFALPYASSLLIAKTPNLNRLNVQVTAYGRQTITHSSMVKSCDPLENFWGFNHITGTVNLKSSNFVHR